jgi:hypothetical protein
LQSSALPAAKFNSAEAEREADPFLIIDLRTPRSQKLPDDSIKVCDSGRFIIQIVIIIVSMG